jgi:hypothetical protein
VRGVSNNSAAGGKERVETYVRAAILAAPKGAQETTLHRESFAIGGLVAIAALNHRDARVALIDPALCTPAYGERRTGLIHEATGKPQPTPVIEFEGRESRDAFSEAVWRAVLDHYPQAREKAEAAS